MNKTVKVLFDANVLCYGFRNNFLRSGIYFCAYNILLNFLKFQNKGAGLDITLYCARDNLYVLKKVLDKEFPGIKFKIVNNTFFSFLFDFYSYIYYKRGEYKPSMGFLKKTEGIIIKLIVKFLPPFLKIFSFIDNILINLKDFSYDVYFSCAFGAPGFIYRNKNIKKFTLIHDLIPLILENQASFNVFKDLYKNIKEDYGRNNFYFTNSLSTMKDFKKYFPNVEDKRMIVTYLACDEKFKPYDRDGIETVIEKYNIPKGKKYVLSLCTLEERKNLTRALKAFICFIKKNSIDDLYFVLAGGHHKDFLEKINKEIENFGEYKDKIIKTGYVDDGDLPFLYSGALWFTYTSLYEGFGLPVLEAMSSGCPCLVSDNTSLPEVTGGEGAVFVSPSSDSAHIEAYEKLYFDKELREKLRTRGLNRAKEFSWEKCASLMVEFFKN